MIEIVRVARGRPPLEWEDDAYASDDGPCQSLADAPMAHDFLSAPEPFDARDRVQAWCEIRHHLRDWLRDPVGIERTLATTFHELATALPMSRCVEVTVGDTLMPRALAHVLASGGIDPRAFGAVALWRTRNWTVHVQGVRIDIVIDIGDDDVRTLGATIHPDGIALWDMGDCQVALYDTLPETVARASVGRPISDIVSHPVLDALGHRVCAVTEWTGSILHYREGRVALRDIRIEG